MVAPSPTEPAIRFERYEDFRRWTESQPGYRSLVRGAPRPGPSPSRRHQVLVLRLAMLMVEAVVRPGRGEVYLAPLDVKLAEDTVRQPDLLVVLAEHADRLRETHLEGAPDLVVEVLSPTTARLDLWEKRHDYERAGVQEYRVVDPDTRIVELYARQGERLLPVALARGQGTLPSRLLPDLRVDLAVLFPGL